MADLYRSTSSITADQQSDLFLAFTWMNLSLIRIFCWSERQPKEFHFTKFYSWNKEHTYTEEKTHTNSVTLIKVEEKHYTTLSFRALPTLTLTALGWNINHCHVIPYHTSCPTTLFTGWRDNCLWRLCMNAKDKTKNSRMKKKSFHKFPTVYFVKVSDIEEILEPYSSLCFGDFASNVLMWTTVE